MPIVVAGYALDAFLAGDDHEGLQDLGYWIVYIGVCSVWVLAAWPIYEAVSYLRGRTIGMAAVGLRIQHVERVSPTVGQAIARGLLIAWPVGFGVVLYAVPSLLYLGWLTWSAARDPLGRHWVDRVTGSVVLPRDAQVFDLTR